MAAYPDGLDEHNARGAPPATLLAQLLPLVVLGAIVLLAFTGLLGGGPKTTFKAEGPKGAIAATVPEVIRNGMIVEMRFTLVARQPVANATLVIDRSYLADITVNTSMPQPEKEEAQEDAYRFAYGPMKPGEQIDIKLDGQINPDLFGGTKGTVAFADGEQSIAGLSLHTRVLP